MRKEKKIDGKFIKCNINEASLLYKQEFWLLPEA